MIAIIAVSALSLAVAAVALASPAIAKTAQSDNSLSSGVTVTETLAKALAEDEVDPEASFQSIKLEDENGTAAYEVTFIQDDKPVEVNIDATSGATLSVHDENDEQQPSNTNDKSAGANVDATSSASLSVQNENNEQQLAEAGGDNCESEDENDDDSLEESEHEDDDYETDGIDYHEEGENETEN